MEKGEWRRKEAIETIEEIKVYLSQTPTYNKQNQNQVCKPFAADFVH
jgi:hypothetical protein